MRVARSGGRRPRRRSREAAAIAALAVCLAAAGVPPGSSPSSRASEGGEPVPWTDDSVPAREVTMIAATPAEAGGGGGETWGVGQGADGAVVVRYASASGGAGQWSLAAPLRDGAGAPLQGFQLDAPEAAGSSAGPSPLSGQMTADGAGVLAGALSDGEQTLLVREPNDPANAFQETAPSAAAQLHAGERLFSFTRAPLIAPLDEAEGHAGALLVPVRERNTGIEETVLHWHGATREWTREPIELPADASATEFRVLAIAASSQDAWLLGQLAAGQVALFRRHAEGSGAVWRPVALAPGGEPGEALTVDGEPLAIPGARREEVRNQVLTATPEGVWIDGERPSARASTTVFFKPAGEAGQLTSWCTLEASPPGTAPCGHTLPEALPTGPSRSFAWSGGAGGFGERVVTGLPEGVSLRLEGSTFTPVLSLGGTAGSSYGAAFTSPREGWLGDRQLPVHLGAGSPGASGSLTPWPVSFRHPLLAIAAQPGAAPGELGSEALAVGDLGEVARYLPGKGWLPESLIGADGHRKTPRLRAVAWPTPTRAYAVGDEGQMWMWRGETGLWERDPAAPRGFYGNVLGVAFDPSEAARGYAVGESGVLLSYGKEWSQWTPEEQPAQSPCPPGTTPATRCSWADASFTSIAFAGTEAIVAYRLLLSPEADRYVGGLIVNDGSGWQLDTGAREAMGADVPWAVAGLPDGGAAFAASGTVFEREGPGRPWQATATPFPGGSEPGSLSLFREGGALRVLAAGSAPDTYSVERAPQAPPGFPPSLIAPYPLPGDDEAGVIRQSAAGWQDEEHDLDDVREPPGNWSYYDTVFHPEPLAAVLVGADGSQGWAVGGQQESEPHGGEMDTADVERYGGEASAPTGAGTAAVPIEAGQATFAIGGGAQCAAPCSNRAFAGLGPDVWLSSALQRAAIPGVRAFIYTGPRLPDPKAISGPRVAADQFSYAAEFGRYQALLGASPLPAYAVATPSDRDESGSELSLESLFGSFPEPLGGGAAEREALVPLDRGSPCGAASGCEGAYYAFDSTGPAGTVRAVVLDDSAEGEVGSEQLAWLEAELRAAAGARTPAIVVGNPDLVAQLAAGGHPGAGPLACALVRDGASAYFFDAPEANLQETLRYCGGSLPTFGSGTLGYVRAAGSGGLAALGASGFLLAQVDVADRDEANVAPVTVRLIPDIGELALEAGGGTLVRRSQAALFSALARRPRSGNRTAVGGAPHPETDPYIPIPSYCQGAACADGLTPEYSFTSSKPDIGDFVEPNPSSTEANAVLLGTGERPIHDSSSGLFCAFNAGTTVVTIRAGGLSYSLPVTVEPGSVRRPCGTTPLLEQTSAAAQPGAAPPAAPAAAASGPASSTPPVPPPPTPLPVSPSPPPAAAHAPAPAPLPATPLPAAPSASLIAFIAPPLPTPARPSPPSGTTTVSAQVAEHEEEEEHATETAANNAMAYIRDEHEPTPEYLLALAAVAALAGVSLRRRPGARRQPRIAPAGVAARPHRDVGRRRRGMRPPRGPHH